jgi:tetratricopeptide (TPR) repeat protein
MRVAALGGRADGDELQEYLHGLERKQFVGRDRDSSLAGEPQYAFAHVLVRDVAYGQIPRAARARKHAKAAGWIESLGRTEDQAEMLADHYLSALELGRAASQDTTALAAPARAALRAAGDRAFTLNAFTPAARYYRAALAVWPQGTQEQRAGLLRLLGIMLYMAGDLEQAETVVSEGAKAAAAAGLSALQARIGILLAEIHTLQGGPSAAALAECEAAIAVLDSESDLEGLAEAWTLAGRLRFGLGDSPAAEQALERAIAYARQCANHRAESLAASWLAVTLTMLPVPADAAVARTEQLLQAVGSGPWAEADLLTSLQVLYAYTGRFADARAASARCRSVYAGSGAKVAWAECTSQAGQMELIAGDPAAAERYLREGYEAFRAMGERGYLSSVAGWLAGAVYAQGRLDEAQQMTEEAQAATVPGDIDAQVWWRVTRARLLARGGHFPAARTLLDEVAALVSPTSCATFQAQILMAKAEVDQLAGAPRQAERSLRAALRIYQDRHATPLADQATAALANLTGHPNAKPN